MLVAQDGGGGDGGGGVCNQERGDRRTANRDGLEPMSAVGTPGKTCNAN